MSSLRSGSSGEANRLHGDAGTASPCSSNLSSTLCSAMKKTKEEEKKKKKAAPRKTFPCKVCSKTFLTQQAMAGHSSIHAGRRASTPTRTLPLLPATRCTSYAPPGGTTAVSCRVPYLAALHGRNTSPAPMGISMLQHVWPAPVLCLPAPQLGWGAFLSIYSSSPTWAVGAAPPPQRDESSMNQPGSVDLTLKLGAGGGKHAPKNKTMKHFVESTVVSNGQQGEDREGKRVMDGGDQGSKKRKELMDGLDLELRLCSRVFTGKKMI